MAKEGEDDGLLDKIHDAVKSLHGRMDAFEKERKDEDDRKDAEEKVRMDKARHDSARKDKFGARKDGERHDAWKKRHDEDEKAMCDAMGGDDAAKDSARKDRHDAEEEEKRNDEDFEKWAKEEEKEPEHKKDSEMSSKQAESPEIKDSAETEKEKEEAVKDKARHDAVVAENADLKARFEKMESIIANLTRETPASERSALANAQARADSVAVMFADRAPPPIGGETSLDYRKRMLRRFQAHSPRFKETRFDSYDEASVSTVEDVIYHDAINRAREPGDTRPGQLMAFEERDRAGRTITKYSGDILGFMAPFMTGATTGTINRKPNG
jgi:hypothetical protein